MNSFPDRTPEQFSVPPEKIGITELSAAVSRLIAEQGTETATSELRSEFTNVVDSKDVHSDTTGDSVERATLEDGSTILRYTVLTHTSSGAGSIDYTWTPDSMELAEKKRDDSGQIVSEAYGYLYAVQRLEQRLQKSFAPANVEVLAPTTHAGGE